MRRAARVFQMGVSILNGVVKFVSGVLFLAGPDGRFLQAGALLPVIQELPLANVFFQVFRYGSAWRCCSYSASRTRLPR